MKYKYLKGSEKDFDGAPDWASEVIESTSIYGHAFVDGFDYMCKYQSKDNPYDIGNIINPTLWTVVARRRPITEPSWDGVGLPPAGCECEYVGNDTSWGVVNVIGYDGDKVVFKPSGDTYYAIAPSNKCIFRPIRTEADKNRDDISMAINKCVDASGTLGATIYDAIAAGKIPGVKLED